MVESKVEVSSEKNHTKTNEKPEFCDNGSCDIKNQSSCEESALFSKTSDEHDDSVKSPGGNIDLDDLSKELASGPKDLDISDSDESDNENVSREIEEAVQALKDAEQSDMEGIQDDLNDMVKKDDDETEQQREQQMPDDLPIPEPSPAPITIGDSVSDTNSDVPAPLTPQVPTPSKDSSAPECSLMKSHPQEDTPITRQNKDSLQESKSESKLDAMRTSGSPEDPAHETDDDDIPSDDNFPDDDVNSPSLCNTGNFENSLNNDIQNNFEQIANTSANNSIQSNEQMTPQSNLSVNNCVETPPSVPSVKHSPHSTTPQHQPNLVQQPHLQNQTCSNMQPVFTPQPNGMNLRPSSNLGSNYGAVDIDVVTQMDLESPTSISSSELQNPISSGNDTAGVSNVQAQTLSSMQNTAPALIGSFSDCAQQMPQPYQQINVMQGARYMDMVNSSSAGYNMSMVAPSTLSTNTMPYCSTPASSYTSVLLQQNSTQRLTHSATPCPLPQGPINRQNSAPAGYTGNSCSLAKLQQLTNGLSDLSGMPENQMTPPPTMTPPPPHMTPSPSMIRNLATPPVPNLPSQTVSGASLHQNYKQYQRQRNTRKSPNISVNPNMTSFTPNVTIRTGSNMIVGNYSNIDIYRMQQQTLNQSYMNHHSFINPRLQTPQIPMQMFPNMNMNVNPAQQHFQQHMQPPQSNNMYAYGYINSPLGPSLNNGVMRR